MDLIIFDKDGVLLNLSRTWLPVARDITYLLSDITDGRVSASVFQEIIGINEETLEIDPDGLFAAGSFLDQQTACATHAPILKDHFSTDAYHQKVRDIVDRNAKRDPVPLGDITSTLSKLDNQGYQLAVLTNDSETSARRSLDAMQISSYFTHIVGYDSGYGGKPDPTGFLAICAACDIAPQNTVMIGDTAADRLVADAAGAGLFVGISANYPAPTKALDTAAHLLPNIETLPELLDSLS